MAITHEHSDHIHAIPVMLKKTDWVILATPDTLRAIEKIKNIEIPESRWMPLTAGQAANWEGWTMHPFAIPHDAVDPVAYRIETPQVNMVVMTDLGYPSALAVEYAKGIDFLVIESNHDVVMLREGTYPPHLKSRILSRVGHLSNDACAKMLGKVISPVLKNIVLAHLSEQNNDPALARLASIDVATKNGSALYVASQGEAMALEL
jgi:phosphoribosyl 1,2-cyclic phosphodiesterase